MAILHSRTSPPFRLSRLATRRLTKSERVNRYVVRFGISETDALERVEHEDEIWRQSLERTKVNRDETCTRYGDL